MFYYILLYIVSSVSNATLEVSHSLNGKKCTFPLSIIRELCKNYHFPELRYSIKAWSIGNRVNTFTVQSNLSNLALPTACSSSDSSIQS